jgi:RNA polymerase sigma-70 factor (ECF subfamily)
MSMLAVSRASRATSNGLRPEIEQLFREHSHMLYRTAYGMLGDRADAEDVLQTIFLRLLRRELPPDLSRNPAGYLYRAAVNLSLNVVRSRKRAAAIVHAEAFDIAGDDDGSRAAEGRHRRLMEAIAALDAKHTQVLVLRYVHEQSDAAIAKLLGVSRGTIAMRLFRARLRLKKLIGEGS